LRHTDWYLIEDDRWRGKWLIACLDVASRFSFGYGIFHEASTENAISVLDDCINGYGKPVALLTDHGSQFYARGIASRIDIFYSTILVDKNTHTMPKPD